MLRPLESGIFDSIAGLPLHPLVVHFAVVLLPIAALGLVVLVAVPKWADRFGWLTLAGLAAGTGAAFVAKASGEALAARVGDPASHESWGDVLPWLAVGLLVLAGIWFLLHRTSRRAGRPRSPGAAVTGVLTAVLALVVTGVTVVVGHTGAQAAWAGVTAGADQPKAAPSSSGAPTRTPGSPSASATSGTAGSGTAGSYTMADVAKHASASSCWTAINGKVYNVTDWIGQHPGGQRAILGLCGKDGSAAFNGQHGGERRPASELKQFLIGTLD
jgi:uncharacterized membrane protein